MIVPLWYIIIIMFYVIVHQDVPLQQDGDSCGLCMLKVCIVPDISGASEPIRLLRPWPYHFSDQRKQMD